MRFHRELLILGLSLAAASGAVAQTPAERALPSPGSPPRAAPALPTAPAAAPSISNRETELLDQLHAANQLEIEAGKLALKRAGSAKVKSYGEHLIKDHTQAEKQLNTLARRNGVKLSALDRSKLRELEALRGDGFDRAFLNMMVRDHQRTIELVRTEQARVQNPDVRALLDKVLPLLQKHEQHAQSLNDARS